MKNVNDIPSSYIKNHLLDHIGDNMENHYNFLYSGEDLNSEKKEGSNESVITDFCEDNLYSMFNPNY